MEDGEKWWKQDTLIAIRFPSTALRRSKYDEFGISMYHSFMVMHIQEKTLFKSNAEQERFSEYPRM
jgi:hypothetical protein